MIMRNFKSLNDHYVPLSIRERGHIANLPDMPLSALCPIVCWGNIFYYFIIGASFYLYSIIENANIEFTVGSAEKDV